MDIAYVAVAFGVIIAFTGVLAEIPDALSVLPVPPYVIFSLVFFLGCLDALIRKTVVWALVFIVFAIAYYNVPLLLPLPLVTA